MTDRAAVADRLANQLYRVEASVDVAIVEAGQMLSDLAQARMDAGVSATFDQKAFALASSLGRLLVEVRGASVDLHHRLGAAQRRLQVAFSPPTGQDKDGSFASVAHAPERLQLPSA